MQNEFLEKIKPGMIFKINYFKTSDSYDKITSVILILKKDLLLDLIVMDTETNEIFSLDTNNVVDWVFIDNLSNFIKDNDINNVWLGIDYILPFGSIKLLIDLRDITIEIYNMKQDDWEELDHDFYQVIDDILLINLNDDYQVQFKFNLITLQLSYKKLNSLKFSPYKNFLIGNENDFVFNINNELELTTKEKMEETN